MSPLCPYNLKFLDAWQHQVYLVKLVLLILKISLYKISCNARVMHCSILNYNFILKDLTSRHDIIFSAFILEANV